LSNYIKLVESTVNSLRILSDHQDGIGVREMSRLLDMNKSTSHRLLLTLQKEGLVEFDEITKKYRMSLGILQLTNKIPQKNNLISSSLPYMENLRDLTNETVALHIRILDYRMVIAKVESNLELRWSPLIGKPYSLFLGASSKVIMAFMPQKSIEELIESLPNEIDRTEFALEMERIRKDFIAISHGEIDPGGMGVAAPILNQFGNLIATISVYALEIRMNSEKLEILKQEVIKTTKLITKTLNG
jgi:IclR family transcriptional regulator, KDG regulon repressor